VLPPGTNDEQAAEAGQAAGGGALHSADRAAERVGGGLLGEVLDEAEHQHLALPAGQRSERRGQALTTLRRT